VGFGGFKMIKDRVTTGTSADVIPIPKFRCQYCNAYYLENDDIKTCCDKMLHSPNDMLIPLSVSEICMWEGLQSKVKVALAETEKLTNEECKEHYNKIHLINCQESQRILKEQIEQAKSDERAKCEKEKEVLRQTIQDRISFENEQEKHIKKIHDEARASFLAVIDGKIGELEYMKKYPKKGYPLEVWECCLDFTKAVLTDLKEEMVKNEN
jgi:hypothetical protein